MIDEQMSQGGLIIALLTMLALSIGVIALLAYLSSVRTREVGARGADPRSRVDIDEALELHRQRMFLRRHPDWEGRDFRADRSSPWYTDPDFAERAGRR